MDCVLVESVSALPKQTAPGRYKIRLIGADVLGSSGYYSREVLERDGAIAFPRLTKIYADHPTASEQDELPERSVKNIAGKFVTDPWMEEDGLYSEVQFGRAYQPLVEDFHDVLGMSIRAKGNRESRTVDGEEVLEVKELFASPFNSCDLVTVAGANGAIIEALAESAKNSTADAVVENEKGRKSHNMEIDELATKVDALVESVSALTGTVTTLVEASKPAPVETSDEEPAATADVADAIEKAVDAGLPKEVRQEIKESLERDPSIDVDKLIEKKKAFLDDLRESLAEDAGYVHESASGKSSATDFIPAGWKR